MVRVERRSGEDRRKCYTQSLGKCGRTDSRERRSGKDLRKSPPAKAERERGRKKDKQPPLYLFL